MRAEPAHPAHSVPRPTRLLGNARVIRRAVAPKLKVEGGKLVISVAPAPVTVLGLD